MSASKRPPIQAYAGDEHDKPRRLRAEQRSALRAAATAAEGEITPTPTKEQDMTDTTLREPLHPIYGPNDGRYVELAAYMAMHADRFIDDHYGVTATVEDLQPIERAEWYARCIEGESVCAFDVGVEIPDFPSEPTPKWSTSSDFRGITSDGELPMLAHIRELSEKATIEREDTFDPDTGNIRRGPVFLSFWYDDSTELRFTSPVEAVRFTEDLVRAVHEFATLREAEAERELFRPASVDEELRGRDV